MISGRSLAQDASTPWKRIRCNRGRGTSAASRCMNSSGDITIWADSSLPCEHHLPGPVERKPCEAQAERRVATNAYRNVRIDRPGFGNPINAVSCARTAK